VRTYGLGSLSTSSFRGGSSSHTAILWNNFNINSPMNGILDLSLLPVTFFNDVQIQHGGNSALWGNGAIGGAIHLNQNPHFNQGIIAKASITAGSFGSFSQQFFAEISQKKWLFNVNFFNHTAENDFTFKDVYSFNQAEKKQTNAYVENRGVSANAAFVINKNQQLKFSIWQQSSDRGIPPTLVENESLANQQDETLRTSITWNYIKNRFKLNYRTAYFREQIDFNDPNANLFAVNLAHTLIHEIEGNYHFSTQHLLNFGINNTFYSSTTDGYPFAPQQNRLSFFTAYQFNSKNQKLHWNTALRQEIAFNNAAPFTASSAFEYQFIDKLSLKVSAARVYRLPSFNDLFWTPGGNPDLLPENGFTQDVGLAFNHQKKNWDIYLEQTVFNRNIDDWIIWLPTATFWIPQNVMKVWSRGLESTFDIGYQKNKFKIQLNGATTYVLSTNRKSKSTNDNSLHKQLIYVPKFTSFFRLSAQYKNFSLAYRHQYNSARFTSTDNQQSLPAFQLGSMIAGYDLRTPHSSLRLFFEVNNIWNEQYQAVRNRPMPLSNFTLGFNMGFHQKNKL
jgi:iron complex outermembrane receptor protein